MTNGKVEQPPVNHVVTISGDDAYELLKLRAARDIESHLLERLGRVAKWWGGIAALALAIATVFGFLSISSYLDRTVASGVDHAIRERVDDPLSKLQGRIDTTWESGILAKGTSEEARDAMLRTQSDLDGMKSIVASVERSALAASETVEQLRVQLRQQEGELAKTQQRLVDLYKNLRTETFKIEEGPRTRVISITERNALVVIRLESTPIRESVRLQWHIFSQPPNSYWLNQNVLLFNWGDDVKKLSTQSIYVSYSVDSSAPPPLGDLSVGADGVYAGKVKVLPLVASQDAPESGEKPPK